MTCAEIFSCTRRNVPSVALLMSLLVSLLVPGPAHAQLDSEDKTEQKPPIQQDQAETKAGGVKSARGSDKSADKADETGSIERFDPSEEISKDLSVSFPVDI